MVEIEFLLVKPAPGTESRRAQELRIAAARSHAARVTHHRARQRKKELREEEIDDREEGFEYGCCYHSSSKTANNGKALSRWIQTQGGGPASRNRLVWARENHDRSPGCYSPEDVVQSTVFLGTILSQGRQDPFGSYDGSNLPCRLLSVLENAYEVVWPKMVQSEGDQLAVAKKAWRQAAVQYPFLFHCQVMGAAGAALSLCEDEVAARYLSLKRLEHQMIAIKLIREELHLINSGRSEPSDELIMAILNLVTSSGDVNEAPGDEVHPKSPLAQAQPVGRVKLNDTHLQAVHMLIKRKGGLQGLQSYALGYMIEVVDIYVATLRGSRPLYPWLHGSQDLVAMGKHIPDKHATDLSAVLGTGLTVLATVDVELHQLYLEACQITIALDQYHRDAKGHPSLSDLVDARNKTQHGFCSLAPSTDSETDPFAALYETCRLAGLIFSDMVILPLPHNSGVKLRLARRLRTVLEASSLQTSWKSAEYGNLLMWVVFMGTIAATFTKARGWYLQKLRNLIDHQQLDWNGFRGLMKTFLWWDFVFEAPAARIWNEMNAPSFERKSDAVSQ
ncbi:uncharacterized protein A1O5_03568 [Cladophialophora psammophila CBS 110553]|uniref:Uncharacterized protein n=1 Tax=Cladophialophora psammophila CBS 110553 TaxID=1182543 RepID=W9XA45_9EURO|nr:uncharacterized protein A1O5_03568 [Cladophialophora psammophila CBS 110553]EXJ73806.1 hypothetical protein A1O5_03568 [Cladophialophora psammophila CBS 110553]